MTKHKVIISCDDMVSMTKHVLARAITAEQIGTLDLDKFVKSAIDVYCGLSSTSKLINYYKLCNIDSVLIDAVLDDYQDYLCGQLNQFTRTLSDTVELESYTYEHSGCVTFYFQAVPEINLGELLLDTIRHDIEEGMSYPNHIRRMVGR